MCPLTTCQTTGQEVSQPPSVFGTYFPPFPSPTLAIYSKLSSHSYLFMIIHSLQAHDF